jgi:prepilin-type processing-associated H-X9-DG protein
MMGEIRTPGKTPAFLCTFSHHTSPDGVPRGFGWGADDAVNTQRHPNRHGNGSNYAFLDGHVGFYRPAGGIFCVPIDGLDYDGNGTYGGKGTMR